MQNSTAIKQYYQTNPSATAFSYRTLLKEDTNFREYLLGNVYNDLGLAFGSAYVNFDPVEVNTVKQSGRICITGAHIRGAVDDLYDFNYFGNDLFAKRGAAIQTGWSSNLGTGGTVFQSHFDVDKNIDLDFCLN